MPFWSSETLKKNLPPLISDFNDDRIDCAAYTLTLGDEVFVTSDLPDVGDFKQGVKAKLSPGQQVRIAPGQFAFLRTHEIVEVPHNAIAFISMKATIKFRGLINVSGFHVDPGHKNYLIFSVYNAGPAPIVVSQGMPLFLIWYADLDQISKKVRPPERERSIDSNLISNMSGQVFSPIALNREIGRLHEKVSTNKENLVELKALVAIVTTIVLGAISVAGYSLWFLYKEHNELKAEMSLHKATSSQGVSPIISNKPDNSITTTVSEGKKGKK